MFEYIKRVSIAVGFISQKIGGGKTRLKCLLEEVSLELVDIAQAFREDSETVEDLQKLQHKILYCIDLIDYARIHSAVSVMNANIFTDSMLPFLKHVANLIEYKNSLHLPVYQLSELDEMLARKNAKAQVAHLQNKTDKFSFTEIPTTHSSTNILSSNSTIAQAAPKNNFQNRISNQENSLEEVKPANTPKKILEESLLNPAGSVEIVEKEIEERRNKILRILVAGGGSIKEISAKIRDVNEKTIQRDLLELMRDKKVIMLGKKRWSKYYLK